MNPQCASFNRALLPSVEHAGTVGACDRSVQPPDTIYFDIAIESLGICRTCDHNLVC